jgi:predicted XRE-type DNA-binding protein
MADAIEVVQGSGNAFADVGLADSETLKFKAQITGKIIKRLDALGITMRAAAKIADCDASDIQRIRNADVARFTIDRLLKYAIRLGCRVELKVSLPKAA